VPAVGAVGLLLGVIAYAAFARSHGRPRESTTAATRAAGASADAAAGSKSVAVLPFVDMSADKENEYFSDGMTEELIDALAKVEGLQVAARTSSFAFKGKSEDVRKIGQLLNVQTVLEGSVRKAGNRLRISVHLVNVADGYHLWSETYNRELADIFDIQDEIAQSITKALRVILTEKEKQALEKAPAADVRAYDCYLRGRHFFHQFRRKGFEFAIQMFERAIALDPSYARAYAGLADCCSLLYMYWDTRPANLQRADEASRKALQLDPRLAEAHVARGLAVSLKKQYPEAERAFETATQLDPNLFAAYYFYGRTCLAQGKLLEAAQLFEQACRLRPDDYQAASHLGSIYAGLGRTADAQAAGRRCLDAVEKHLGLHPDDARAIYLGAVVWCQLGDADRAVEWANRALAMDPEEPVTLYNVACVYSLQGKLEQAIDCLEGALKHGFAHKAWIEHDADLNAIRAHPRYQELLRAMQNSD
jgi:TolB-like protein/Tfp pilus assembly protein PilF